MHARRAGRLAALVLLTAAFAGVLTTGPAGGPARAHASPGAVLVVGDSLAVGLEPYLGGMLGDRSVAWDARSGRTTPEGLFALRAAVRVSSPDTVVVSLGTNDGPDPARFRSRIERVLAAVPRSACVVWATVIRAPRKGPYHALNHVLREESRRRPDLVLVNWARAVATGRVSLPDGVHPDATGFAYRSRMIATAVDRGC